MPRAVSTLDFSIAGDDHERSRIQLEHNLQNTDLSLHLSSAHEDDYSIEFPRHNSGPQPSFSAFRSIDPSQDDFDLEEGISHLNAWSYRTGDDDEGIHPYAGGETLSTAAHHASALTLSAGLGGRGARRDISMSGAEYDPERPLQDLVANVNSKLSMLDIDETRSRLQSAPLEPSVPGIGRAPSRHAHATASRLRSSPSSSSSSEPETPPAASPRPTLATTLNHLTFSPKRPRSPAQVAHASSNLAQSRSHGSHSSRRQVSAGTRAVPSRARSPILDDGTTPRARKTRQKSSRSALPSQPEITVRPPTPSSGNSKFTALARDLAREIGNEQLFWNGDRAAASADGGSAARYSAPRSAKDASKTAGHANTSKRHLNLPDVTGLTVAVESPAKAGVQYYAYRDDGRHDAQGKTRLVEMLSLVQDRLAQLEGENNSSRHRMRELERELDMCKTQVAVERERMMKREADFTRYRDEMRRHVDIAQQTKIDARAANNDSQRRYKEAVEEKKALESLISTLRSHMERLTGELTAHRSMLDDLRSMREADTNAIYQKTMEIDKLRKEVERIAGEVEVLKDVVEDGLRERRARRDRSASPELTPQSDAEADGIEKDEEAEDGLQQQERIADESLYAPRESSPPASPERNTPHPGRSATVDRTMRTDRATAGSSQLVNSAIRPFVDESEIARISEELEERRSLSRLSTSQGSRSQSSTHSHSSPPSRASSVSGSERGQLRGSSRLSVLQEEASVASQSRASISAPDLQHEEDRRSPSPSPVYSRPASRLARPKAAQKPVASIPEATPFPQIRGERLERLFFSAPEHNAKSCTVCRRRRRPISTQAEDIMQPVWYASRASRSHNPGNRMDATHEDVDEGYEEGEDGDDSNQPRTSSQKAHPSSGRPHYLDFLQPGTPADRLPPQTVLVKILRELEDDFTHYKGVYLELAHQYGLMDPVSNVVKRNVLAEHLREVIDILEQRGDQIASLYDLLSFEDKPLPSNPTSKPETAPRAPGISRAGSKKRATFA